MKGDVALKITPLDIKKQDFKRVLRGFDPVEVETFLEMVSEEFEALIKAKNELADEVLRLKTQLKDYQEVEKTFKESLMSAQQTINQSRENSQKEANLIIREAEIKAEKILEDTKIQLIEMRNELMLIKAQKDSFAKRLRHLLESQLELIGVLELDDLGLGNDKSAKKTAPQGTSQINKFTRTPSADKKARHVPGNERQAQSLAHKKENKSTVNNLGKDGEQLSDQFII